MTDDYGYYDWQGRRIDDDEYRRQVAQAQTEGRDWKRVASTELNGSTISTVHIRSDHRHFGDGPPIIFETLVMGGGLDNETERYSTPDEARAGHAVMVQRVKDEAVAFAAFADDPDVRDAVRTLRDARANYLRVIDATNSDYAERGERDYGRLLNHIDTEETR